VAPFAAPPTAQDARPLQSQRARAAGVGAYHHRRLEPAIAQQLHLGEGTVRNLRQQHFVKLGVANRAEAAVFAPSTTSTASLNTRPRGLIAEPVLPQSRTKRAVAPGATGRFGKTYFQQSRSSRRPAKDRVTTWKPAADRDFMHHAAIIQRRRPVRPWVAIAQVDVKLVDEVEDRLRHGPDRTAISAPAIHR
jgi:hypothetical protein